jgi:1-acyl-sn-glycerol-3-phosphate acyltransferase
MPSQDLAQTPDESETSTTRWTLRKLAVAVGGSVILIVGAAVMLLVALLTFFQTRRFCSEVIAKTMARLGVAISGVQVVVHRDRPLPETQTVYIANHTATLDLFVVTSLGLPKTRYFLSGFLRKILPLGLIGYLIGVFWTVPQDFPEQRRKIFQRAARRLRQSGDSVFLTPEGGRICTGEIGHFNRGAFHLATSLQADIVPIYLHVPDDAEAGMNLVSKKTTVDVFFLPTISTAGWTVDEVDQNRDAVRDLYVRFHRDRS